MAVSAAAGLYGSVYGNNSDQKSSVNHQQPSQPATTIENDVSQESSPEKPSTDINAQTEVRTDISSGSSNQSSVNTEVTVNGRKIPVEENQTTHRTIKNDNGTTTNVTVQNNSSNSPNGSSFSHSNSHVQSHTFSNQNSHRSGGGQ